MGNIVVTEFITLDGVVQDPNLWSFPYATLETGQFKFAELQAQGAHLLGRVTYAGFAQAWPSRTDAMGFSDRFNALPKYVVSTTLQKAEWQGSTILRGADLPAEIAQVKAAIDGDLIVAGSATLVQSLMQHNLVDEYRLLTYPLVLGEGRRLFGRAPARLQLLEQRPMGSTGVVLLRYAPAPAA
ncbi:MAG: dihydrofolate reductase family protein [Anaerolineales bacterium]|nr:dihydrofolate reductase family protein [Anaerolineales bacterium]